MWNQIPVTLGNIAGGVLFTGMALYATHRKREVKEVATVSATTSTSIRIGTLGPAKSG